MLNITAIITSYRRPANIEPLVGAIRGQTTPASGLWAWANEPNEKMKAVLAEAKLDRVVTCSENAYFHGRFALALLAQTEFVAIFDDDSIPGDNWFANCLDTMHETPGILGTAGVVLHEPGYAKRTMHGWQRPSDKTIEVDLVGQAWFLRTEWVKHLFSGPPVTGANGEDIELAARAWRLARIRSFCPPHPANDQSRWGSICGMELGLDEVAASHRVEHLAERKQIVETEIAAGWQPLFMRNLSVVRGQKPEISGQKSEVSDGGNSVGNALCDIPPADETPCAPKIETELDCSPSWVTQYSYPLDNDGQPTKPAVVTLSLRGVPDERCCVECLDVIQSLGGDDGAVSRYDRIQCGQALEHARDPLAFLRRARRLLKPGGELTASVANARRESVIRLLIEGHWQATGVATLRYFTRRELEKLLYRSGFRVSEISPSPPLQVAPSSAPFLPGLRAEVADEFKIERYQFTAVADELPDYGLTSIVIPVHNQLAYTRACLESIRFLTDEPYELIVVDNGSTDGTTDYLRSCPDVTLIENADNRGFPAAANQGIRASTGAQVLLLNNDVIVTTGWLRRMLEALEGTGHREQGTGVDSEQWSVDSEQSRCVANNNCAAKPLVELTPNPYPLPPRPSSRVGLVGPLTNCSSGCQEIAIPYTDLACLDGFAWEHAKAHPGQLQEVDRLIGFCLLIRREVIDQVGFLDERFGIGNFEDDDYCRRARDAGWRLVVAQDAFIHHFGHRTFDAAGVDLSSLLDRNRQLFDEKWATEGTANRVQGTEEKTEPRLLPGLPICSLSPKPCSLSLCMIVRNNAGTIRACLESIKPWVDEMIVVDTGSTDATPDICRELGAQVYHFPWPDSFSIARNESLKHAKGEWIFWMDSDDVIDAENGRKLRELVNSLAITPKPQAGTSAQGSSVDSEQWAVDSGRSRCAANINCAAKPLPSLTTNPYPLSPVLGYVMQVHCPGHGPDGMHDVTVVDHLKLFRNRPDLRFEGRIHEQVLDAINRAGGDAVFTDIFVVHAGADHSPEGRKKKLKRDIKLLCLDRRERPNHTFVHFNLGMTYADAGKHRKAIRSLRRSLELARPHESHVRKAYALLAASCRELGQKTEARQAAADGLKLYPKDPELLFRNAMLSHEDGWLRAAELGYLATLANDDCLHFSSIDRGIVGFKARQNLAAVYTDMGALHKAEAEWRRIIADVPTYGDGWAGLVGNLLLQGRVHDAAQAVERLGAADGRLRGLAWTLAALVSEARGNADEALSMLRHARSACPDDATPLDDLSRLLYCRGELAEAEEALRDLARRQPRQAAAQHNLGTVLLRTGRFQEAIEAFCISLRERPNYALTQLSLGYALSNAGRRSEARAAFEQCVRLSPEAPFAAEAQRQLAALAA